MVVHPAPTSPKQQLKNRPEPSLPADWSTQPMMQPPRTPWGRLTLLSFVISLIGAVTIVAGWAVVVQRYPKSWPARWWPSATTTVVNQARTPAVGIPNAVQRTADHLFSLATERGANDVYTASDVMTTIVPISSGWALGLAEAVPASGDFVLLPNLGAPVDLLGRVPDPATPFVYLQAKSLPGASASLSSNVSELENQAVWIVNTRTHQVQFVTRTLMSWSGTDRRSSDQLQRWLTFDSPVSSPVGSVVINRQGEVVGLLGSEQKVWPVAAVEPVLKSLLQLGLVERPVLGVTALNRAEAVVASDLAARGWLLSAEEGQSAVVPGSPAAEAGFQAGDVIQTMDDQAPTIDLFLSLLDFRPGQQIVVKYQRDGVTKEASVELGTLRP